MTNNLLTTFKEMLNETDWMDEQSKKVALEKVRKRRIKLFFNVKLHLKKFG